jgi:hypothetical protein
MVFGLGKVGAVMSPAFGKSRLGEDPGDCKRTSIKTPKWQARFRISKPFLSVGALRP